MSRAVAAPFTPSFRFLAGCVLACATALAAGRAWADPPGRVGRIADTQGTVWLYDDEDGEWTEARRNRPVTAGDRISAERGARATVQIGSGAVRIDADTEIEFVALDDRRVQVQLHNGSVALRLRSAESAREFSVSTAEGRFDPTRAGRYRIDRERGGSFGAVTVGAMRFEASDSALEINAGQRAEFWNERGTTHYAWAQMADDRFGEWVAREEREDDRYFSRDERRRHVSPEMTGAEDLDRNGDWDRHPEYGTIWYPRAVVAGWAPYRYGQWAYVRPWGWTWVDDAPWGFAPFHYGRWVSHGGRWGWLPGTYVARPVYAPALVAWFGSGNVSVSIGVGPSVGWVPLAPREVYVPPYRVTNIYVRNVNVTHEHWHPRRDRGGAVPTGPIMYTNQGVAGGVTVVSSDVLKQRQPISGAVVRPVDNRTIGQWQQQAPRQQAPTAMAPPAPTVRVQPAPGGAVPAAPGAQGRNTPWMPRTVERGGNNNNGAANDAGDARRARPMPPGLQQRDSGNERRVDVPRERAQQPQGDDGQRRGGPPPQRTQPSAVQQPAPAVVQPVPPQAVPQRPVQVAPPQAMPPQQRVDSPRPAPQESRGRGNDRDGDGQRDEPRRRGESREQQNR
jgi:hypothetical protein